MHTLECDKTRFHYNSDLSGDVIVQVGNKEMKVPGVDLLRFVADFVRYERIGDLEDASDAVLLGLPNTMVFDQDTPDDGE